MGALWAMANKATVEAVGRIASDFYRLHHQSMLDLLKASGYLQEHDAISEQELQDFFQANPDLIQPWFILSENQMTESGYYLLPPGIPPNRGIDWVGSYHPNGKKQHFSDGPKACAKFVKVKAEDLRYLIEGGPLFKIRK